MRLQVLTELDRLARGWRSRIGRIWWAAALVVGPLQALDPSLNLTQYAHTSWNRGNGGLSAHVEALAQTADGSLWLGTDGGLLRFDGVRFEHWKFPQGQQLLNDSVLSLTADRENTLWIGTRDGVSRWTNGKLQNFPIGKRGEGLAVTSILVDRHGTVWAGTVGPRMGGLCHLENGKFSCDNAAERLPGPGVLSLFQDSHGYLWMGGKGLCRQNTNGMPSCRWREDNEAVYAIAESSPGAIWAGGRGLKQLSGDAANGAPVPAVDAKLQVKSLLADRDGGLWIGTWGQGLLHLSHGKVDRLTETDGLSNEIVLSLLEDREGNIWVGTDGGLDRFRQYSVTRITRRDGISSRSVTAVFPDRDGSLWAGTVNGVDHLVGGHTVQVFDRRDGMPSDEVTGIFQERNGRLWVATGLGLAYRENGRFHSLALHTARKIWFRSAVETRDQSVWLSDPENGLIRLRDASVTEIVPWSAFGNRPATVLEADEMGLWLGFANGAVAHYLPGRPVQWETAAEPDGSGQVLDLHKTRDGSLWVATASGLCRLSGGRKTLLGAANGLPGKSVRAMVEDDDGAFWLTTDRGLASVSARELRKWSADPHASIDFRVLDEHDGARSGSHPGGYSRRAVKTLDGRIWFADTDAVAVVDPRHLPANRLAPAVRIEEIAGGQKTLPAESPVRLPPLTRDVRIRFTAMSFVIPERMHFRYRLDGFDTDWREDAGNRQAVYTNLPPRSYRFRVVASNNDGIWNNVGAAYDFSIAPAFYETRMFRLACLVASMLLLWSGHRLRLRRVSRRLSFQYQTRLEERTRIAREMHDSLLQNLGGFAFQLEGLAKMATLPAAARQRLREIGEDAHRCAREAREFVCDLRAPTLREVDLCDALRCALEEILRGGKMSLRVTVQGTPRPAPDKVRQQLTRIVQEATRNAARYSHATEIGIEIAYAPDELRLLLSDDGCGFDTAEASNKKGHWGLRTMQERAEEIGGRFSIASEVGQGTKIEVVAPLSAPA